MARSEGWTASTARDSLLQPSLAGAHQRLTSERVELAAISRDLKRLQYEQLILRVRTMVEATLPKGALALVVSKGDEQLLAFGGRKAWHFLRNEQGAVRGPSSRRQRRQPSRRSSVCARPARRTW